MTPKHFKEVNIIMGKNQPEYLPLPAHKELGGQGRVTACWKLSFWERLRVLFLGEIWVSLMMFGQPLTPSQITTKKSDVL